MSAERVREFYRRQGEERARARAGHPSSFNNIAFDTGVIAERERIFKLIAAQVCDECKPKAEQVELKQLSCVQALSLLKQLSEGVAE